MIAEDKASLLRAKLENLDFGTDAGLCWAGLPGRQHVGVGGSLTFGRISAEREQSESDLESQDLISTRQVALARPLVLQYFT